MLLLSAFAYSQKSASQYNGLMISAEGYMIEGKYQQAAETFDKAARIADTDELKVKAQNKAKNARAEIAKIQKAKADKEKAEKAKAEKAAKAAKEKAEAEAKAKAEEQKEEMTIVDEPQRVVEESYVAEEAKKAAQEAKKSAEEAKQSAEKAEASMQETKKLREESNLSTIQFVGFTIANYDADNRILGNSIISPLKASSVRWLTPWLKYNYNGNVESTLQVDVLLTRSDGSVVVLDDDAPKGYSDTATLELEPGEGRYVSLFSWGSDKPGFISAGEYKISIFYKNEEVYTFSFTLE